MLVGWEPASHLACTTTHLIVLVLATKRRRSHIPTQPTSNPIRPSSPWTVPASLLGFELRSTPSSPSTSPSRWLSPRSALSPSLGSCISSSTLWGSMAPRLLLFGLFSPPSSQLSHSLLFVFVFFNLFIKVVWLRGWYVGFCIGRLVPGVNGYIESEKKKVCCPCLRVCECVLYIHIYIYGLFCGSLLLVEFPHT